MTEFLLGLINRSKEDLSDEELRLRIGYMGSLVGLVANIILSIIKLIIGYLISSIGVIADGFNNVADSSSAIISLIGFKLASKPPDKEHPHGHGRLEYIAGLIVSFMVIIVGMQFIKSSFERVLNPVIVEVDRISFIILILSIGVKIWLSMFSSKLAKKINSKSLEAIGIDALGDVLITSVVVISIFFGQFTILPLDGIIGMIVSLLIMYSGFNLVKETISPLIGEAPSEEIVSGITNDVLSYDYIIGVHDLEIHNYGAGKRMAIIDAEFPSNVDILTMHKVRTQAEREIGKKYKLTLVIHLDPIGEESEDTYMIRNRIKHIVKENPIYLSMHDFHRWKEKGKEKIEFHMVVDGKKMKKDQTAESIKREVEKEIEKIFEEIQCSIVIDIKY